MMDSSLPAAELSQQFNQPLNIDLALQAAGVGVWEFNPMSNQVRWDERCGELFGFEQATELTLDEAIQALHSEDRAQVTQAIQWAISPQSDGRYDQTYRTNGVDDGQLRWVHVRGQRYSTPAGESYRLTGIAQEVTRQVLAQEREDALRKDAQRQQRIYEAITASTPDLMYVFDLNYRFTYANQALLAMWGSTWDQSIGKDLLENGYEPWHAQMHEQEIDQVVTTKQPIRGEVSFPHAKLGQRIYDYVFAPVLNEQEEVEAVAGTTRDITDSKLAGQRKEENLRELLALFEQSPVGLATLSADDELVFEWANPFYGELVDRPPGALVGKPLLEALPEIKGQGFDAILKNVIATGTPFIALEVGVNILRDGQLTTIYVDLTYQPRRSDQGQVGGILVVATDVTQQVMARKKTEESENRLRSILATAPAGIGLFVGRDLVIENPNQTFIDIVGKGPGIEGLPLREAMPELLSEGQPFLAVLDEVFTTGVPFISPASLVKIVQQGVLKDNYYNISYSPLHNASGEVYAILDIAIDVTAQVKAQQALAKSEAHLQLLSDTVPAMIFYVDAQQRYQSYNETFRHWFGVDTREVIGKTVREFIGEVAYERVLPHLRRAYAGQQERYELWSPSRMGDGRWLAITYTPHKTQQGAVLGLIVHAADITQNKQTELDLGQREDALRNAIELAQLGTWSIEVATNGLTYSARLIEWFGYDPAAQGYEAVMPILAEADRQRVATAVAWALDPQSGGVYNEIYTVIHPITGQRRVLHAQGKTVFDVSGKPVRLSGTAQDITLQQEVQLTLEHQVQQRTRELALSNQELAATMEALAATNAQLKTSNEDIAATNQEYMALNNELQETVSLLNRSNENLQRFAYVASHDLQEPLRKIQQFGDLLKTEHVAGLGDAAVYVDRMQGAANRMSILIADLLSYARISAQGEIREPVLLDHVVSQVVTDLELLIEETSAQINVDSLPMVIGDASQLGQLFQNLLNNALKFRRVDLAPLIRIQASLIDQADLPATVKPIRSAPSYHRLDVIDNGIGFDPQYTPRIFEAFRRLHRKHEYAGTGIGLSISERVATSHGGAITASSQPGQGATFSVYLPV